MLYLRPSIHCSEHKQDENRLQSASPPALLLRSLGYTAGQGRAAHTSRLSLQHNKPGDSQGVWNWQAVKALPGDKRCFCGRLKIKSQVKRFSNTRLSGSQKPTVLYMLPFRKCWLSTFVPHNGGLQLFLGSQETEALFSPVTSQPALWWPLVSPCWH